MAETAALPLQNNTVLIVLIADRCGGIFFPCLASLMEQVYNLILTLTFLTVATIVHYSFLLFRESKVVELHKPVGKHC